MATGINVSKVNVYAVVSPPSGVAVAKANVYAAAVPPAGIDVSKAVVYAVVDNSSWFRIDGASTQAWDATVTAGGGAVSGVFQIDGASTQAWDATVIGPPAAEVRVTQTALEVGQHAAPDVRVTQTALETARLPPNDIRVTQTALETAKYPPNELWTTQTVLEVAFRGEWSPPEPPPGGKRNHSFIGVVMGMGSGSNASFTG